VVERTAVRRGEDRSIRIRRNVRREMRGEEVADRTWEPDRPVLMGLCPTEVELSIYLSERLHNFDPGAKQIAPTPPQGSRLPPPEAAISQHIDQSLVLVGSLSSLTSPADRKRISRVATLGRRTPEHGFRPR
jgi:hypothetical protein